MDQFKHHILVKSIAESLMSGRPLSNHWGFPDFLLNNSQMLEKFFGSEAYDMYVILTLEDKNQLISWYETHGVVATEMFGGELYEDWDGQSICKRDVKLLADSHPVIYRDVVSNIVAKASADHSETIIDELIKLYIDPDNLESLLKENVG